MELQNLIPKKQHGLIKERSTTTALENLAEHIIDHPEEIEHDSAVLLDYISTLIA